MQIRRSEPFFFAKTVDPPKFLFKSETITTSENRSVKVQNETGTCECYSVNFAQILKKATFLMTIPQYNNSLKLEFKWTFFEKRNNLDELINIPTKAEERSMIQISFRTRPRSEHKTGTIRNPCQKLQLIHDSLCFQNRPKIGRASCRERV